jgi:hypothetical protein
MKEDGSERQKVWPGAVFEFGTVSPDGKWAIAGMAASSNPETTFDTMAIPLGGGEPVRVCPSYCTAGWSNRGRVFVVHPSDMGAAKTLLAPVALDGGVPRLPAEGLEGNGKEGTIKGVKIADNFIIPGPAAGQYVWLRESVHRNFIEFLYSS